MLSANLESFRASLYAGRIEWRKHILQRVAESNIIQKDVLDVLLSGDS